MPPQQDRRFFSGMIALIAVVALGAGAGAAWWALSSLTPSTDAPPTVSPPSPAPVAEQAPAETQIPVYWLNASGDDLEPVPATVTLQKSAEPEEILQTALEHLLTGPQSSTYTTTIPQGTKLLALTIEKDGVRVNLSQNFTTGGGSTSMIGRLGQVVYTATSLEPSNQVWIEIEGEPLEYLGGEGLIVDQPMTRQIYKANYLQ